mmetsp:Transcript_1370/g.4082  ORF Transcript_1370/g.4082 Transcript_1370/m.4082 type:complete len:433 (+) Transcript_1370:323-1621(+)
MGKEAGGDAGSGTLDWTGYWRLVKSDHFDEYLKAQEVPWVLRKACAKYGAGGSTDIVVHKGAALSIVTLNAKGVWSRRTVAGRELSQPNAAGTMCKATSCWEGGVHKSVLRSKEGNTWESYRYVEGGVMVVKSVYIGADGNRGSMYWYLEEVHPGVAASPAADQKRAVRVAASDTAVLQGLASARSRWMTPADTIIQRALSAADSPRKGPSGAASPLSQLSPCGSATLSAGGQDSASELGGGGGGGGLVSGGSGSAPASRQGPTAQLGSGPPGLPPSDTSLAARAGSAWEGASDVTEGGGRAPERGMLKSPSSESMNALASADDQRSGSSTVPGGVKSSEALLSFLVSEFGDGRSIAAVVPLQAQLAALEPELLGLSPEQAEGTQLKLASLEEQIAAATQSRGRHAAGTRLLCCTCVCHRYLLPAYLRSWDL